MGVFGACEGGIVMGECMLSVRVLLLLLWWGDKEERIIMKKERGWLMIKGIEKESKGKRRCVFCMVCVWYR